MIFMNHNSNNIPRKFSSFFFFPRRLKIVRLRARGRDCAEFMAAARASREVPTRALLFALTTYGQTFASHSDTRINRVRAMDSLLPSRRHRLYPIQDKGSELSISASRPVIPTI